MTLRKVGLLLLAVMLAAAGWPRHVDYVLAGRGTPGSASFGYGAKLEMDGLYLGDALALATDLPLDWLAISLPWNQYEAPAGATPAWQRLDRVMQFADHQNLDVLFSLRQAPPAATGPDGPLPEQTAQFVSDLARRYPALQAVELFPNANTRSGWGSAPDPRAYMRLYRAVQSKLAADGREMVVAACGLKPVSTTRTGEEINDLEFLQAVLAEATADPLAVVSLDLSAIHGSPETDPHTDAAVLRHYEQVREVMLQNSHQKSLIWISAFSWPSGTITTPGQNTSFTNENASKYDLLLSLTQLRSQLYIGVVIYQSLNPTAVSAQNDALITDEQNYHPFYRVLRELIAENAPEAGNAQKGRPKDELFKKKYP